MVCLAPTGDEARSSGNPTRGSGVPTFHPGLRRLLMVLNRVRLVVGFRLKGRLVPAATAISYNLCGMILTNLGLMLGPTVQLAVS